MAAHSLSSQPATALGSYYLDTSAVIPVVLNEQRTLASTPREARRFAALEPFALRAIKAGRVVKTSLLAIEEIAAKSRGAGLQDAATKAGFKSWRDFKTHDSPAASEALSSVHQQVLQVMEDVVNGLDKLQVTIEHPGDQGGGSPVADGRKLRKAHRMLLRKYATLDPMDALHIVLGRSLGCEFFVTFDDAWKDVTEIEVVS